MEIKLTEEFKSFNVRMHHFYGICTESEQQRKRASSMKRQKPMV